MKLIWTKSNSALSILIRAITGDDCSHFAFVFEAPGRTGLMFESNLLGTHPKFFANAKKHFEIVHSIDLPLSIEREDSLWGIIIERYDNKPYDFGGVFFLGLMVLRERIFKKNRPDKNSWAKDDQFFCDEIYESLECAGLQKIGIGSGMDTPHDVFKKLKGNS